MCCGLEEACVLQLTIIGRCENYRQFLFSLAARDFMPSLRSSIIMFIRQRYPANIQANLQYAAIRLTVDVKQCLRSSKYEYNPKNISNTYLLFSTNKPAVNKCISVCFCVCNDVSLSRVFVTYKQRTDTSYTLTHNKYYV